MILRKAIELSNRVRAWYLRGPLWQREPDYVLLVSKVYRSAAVVLFFWFSAWFGRILSRPARFLLLFFVICAFYCSVSVRNPALILLFLILAAFAVDLLFGWLFLPRLDIRRELPSRVTCGIPFPVVYRIRNRRKHFSACDLLPEPWGEGKFVDRTSGIQYFTVPPGGEVRAELRFQPLRRGPLSFPCAMVESAFPFNIFKHSVGKGMRETVLVRPFHRILRTLRTDAGNMRKKTSLSPSGTPGDSMDFHGCRKFQYGDSVRKIHWRASAKHNTLIVKEFQQEQQVRAAILADVFEPGLFRQVSFKRMFFMLFRKDIFRVDDPVFEAILSLSASIAVTLTRDGYGLSLSAADRSWRRFSASEKGEQVFLDDLAVAGKRLRDPLPDLTAELADSLREVECVCAVLRRFDAPAKELYLLLKRKRIPALFCLVSSEEPPSDLPADVRRLRPEDILGGKVESL